MAGDSVASLHSAHICCHCQAGSPLPAGMPLNTKGGRTPLSTHGEAQVVRGDQIAKVGRVTFPSMALAVIIFPAPCLQCDESFPRAQGCQQRWCGSGFSLQRAGCRAFVFAAHYLPAVVYLRSKALSRRPALLSVAIVVATEVKL